MARAINGRTNFYPRAMLAILLLAAIVRFAYPQSSPQGLQVDEASNLWNAWCILHSGYDEHQVRFPIFYTQSFGDNRSALFLYFLIPFEAVLGPTIMVAHIAAGFYGVCAVALIGYVGRRLGGPAAGLIAALFLAVCPWHVQNTRWAHEATIAPLLVLIAIASLLWAEVPLADSVAKSKWKRAFLAGLLTGIACYGYAAIRLFLPAFLFITCAINYRQWHDWLCQNRRSFIALVFGFAITFTPLLYKHLIDPRINLRGQSTWVWNPADTFLQRLEKIVARYPGHFGIDFLFLHGSGDPSVSPPSGFGNLHWYLLPFLLIGLIAMIYRFRDSLSARVLMIGVVLYPVGDLLNYHNGMNTLRSFPGLPMLILAAAVGADAAVRWLSSQGVRVLAPAIILFSWVFLLFNILFFYQFFGSFNRDPIRWRIHNVDVLEACQWLEPRWQQVDAVFWSQTNRSFLYAPTLDYLRYDTADWFLGGVDRMSSAGKRYAYSDLVVRYGKMYFMFLPQQMLSALDQLKTSHTMHDVVFIVPPGELNLDQHFPITAIIRDPAGNVSLEIIELRF